MGVWLGQPVVQPHILSLVISLEVVLTNAMLYRRSYFVAEIR